MLQRANELLSEMVRLRRAIHQRPELGFRETRTAALIAETLDSLGIRVKTEVGKTGVIGYLGDAGPCVGIRADMDALPIQELNRVPYASQVPGVMHACGHDAHVAMVLGAARLLRDARLPGQVRFLFQPSEEVEDEDGKTGAARVVESGAMEGVHAILCLHVHDETETGYVLISPGPIFASVDTWQAIIQGVGCHAAYPHQGLNPIFLSAQVISALHGSLSRRVDPAGPALISVSTISGGTASNVIPSQVRMSGTIRALDRGVREKLLGDLTRCLEVTRTLGGDFELTTRASSPTLVNDEGVSEVVRRAAVAIVGKGYVLPMKPEMGGEDFSILAREAPGAMFYLGTKKGETRPTHTALFDIDEEALPIGAAVLAQAALDMLSRLAGSRRGAHS